MLVDGAWHEMINWVNLLFVCEMFQYFQAFVTSILHLQSWNFLTFNFTSKIDLYEVK